MGYDLSSHSVWLHRPSPETASDTTKVTSSSEWSLGGEASGTGKCDIEGKCEVGGGVKLSAGVRESYSRSFDISDMSLLNLSSGNQAAWSFNIAWPYEKYGVLRCLGYQGIGELKKLSYGTFQPTMQWFWKVGKDVRFRYPEGLPVAVEFQTSIRHIWHYQYECPDWTFAKGFNGVWPSGVLKQTMLVPWPAIVK